MRSRQTMSGAPVQGPFPDLLTTNREPSPQEIITVKQVITEAESEIRALQSASTLGNRMDRRRYTELASLIYSNRVVLSSIRRVPIEVLERIFAFVAFDTLASETYPLNQVSRLWKQAAQSSPEYRGVLPPIRLPRKLKGSEFVDSFNSFIARAPDSGTLSLHFVDVLSKERNAAAHILYPTSNRWHSVAMKVDMWNLSPVNEPLYENTQNLRRVKLHIVSNGRRYQSSAGHFGAFLHTPLLSELELECQTSVQFFFPWWNLTSYKLRSYLPIGLSQVLRDDSVIEHLDYRAINPFSLYIAPLPSAVLHNLKTLVIIIYTGSPDRVLGPVTAPRLEAIRICDNTQMLVRDLQEFLTRSQCGSTLTKLSFHSRQMDPGELTKILLLTPALTDLECPDIPFSDICTLSIMAERSTLVPFLQSLVIHSPSVINEIEALVETRSRIADSHLRQVEDSSSQSTWRFDFSARFVFQSASQCNAVTEKLLPASPHFSNTKLSEALWELDLAADECKGRNPRRNSLGIIDSISDRNLVKRLQNGISFLEGIPIEGLVEFQVWILSVLHRFRTLEEGIVPQQEKFKFLERVNDLFAIYMLLLAEQCGHRKFVRHGRYCLLFVTYPRDAYAFEEAFLHGRYKIVDDAEVFWPYKDHSDNEFGKDSVKWRREAGQQ